MIGISGAAVDNTQAAIIIGLMVGEAREANISAVLLVQGVVYLANNRAVGFAEGRAADLPAGQPKRGSVGRGDGDGIRKGIGVVLELSKEEQPILDDRTTQGDGLV